MSLFIKNKVQTPHLLLLLSILVFILVFAFVKPIAQDMKYHVFVNNDMIFGIPNFWNVISNIGFIIVGIYGLFSFSESKSIIILALFFGIIATGIGSSYYHWNPTNQTLVWDRLPMTIVFSSFFALVYSWYFSKKTALIIWILSVAVGIISVFYWQYTETLEQGDLRLYGIVQFLPILLILILLAVNHKQNKRLIQPLYQTIVWYIVAKLFENYDYQISEILRVMGGHPLKHFAAAMACYYIVVLIRKNE